MPNEQGAVLEGAGAAAEESVEEEDFAWDPESGEVYEYVALRPCPFSLGGDPLKVNLYRENEGITSGRDPAEIPHHFECSHAGVQKYRLRIFAEQATAKQAAHKLVELGKVEASAPMVAADRIVKSLGIAIAQMQSGGVAEDPRIAAMQAQIDELKGLVGGDVKPETPYEPVAPAQDELPSGEAAVVGHDTELEESNGPDYGKE